MADPVVSPFVVKDSSAKELIRLEGIPTTIPNEQTAQVLLGAPAAGGQLYIFPKSTADKLWQSATVRLNGETARIVAGGNDRAGNLLLFPKTVTATDTGDVNKATIVLDGSVGNISLREPTGAKETINISADNGIIRLGGNGTDGDLILFSKDVDRSDNGKATMHLDGDTGNINLRTPDTGGQTVTTVFSLDALNGNVLLGGPNKNGNLYLYPAIAENRLGSSATIRLEGTQGNIRLGGSGVDGDLLLFRRGSSDVMSGAKDNEATIHLDGDAGDITLRGGDCAEYFAVSEHQSISPGMVLIAESDEMLSPSQIPYDKRVVGVVSGAGSYKPGILLGKDLKDQGLPIALSGKVYCSVDASNGAISVGDLLTTSSTPGHAMKADDPYKSFGAIIGKALKPLTEGKGLIPILVALQ